MQPIGLLVPHKVSEHALSHFRVELLQVALGVEVLLGLREGVEVGWGLFLGNAKGTQEAREVVLLVGICPCHYQCGVIFAR
ncbi:hypothetical protein FGO68_gene2373 [Halteria grandinella]|uniref:Uncharacterized protein n=1 Tax=Halteria grandinella TaxID=5974 RepID=A0A8J8NF51_HALGN|nr:hypothetical protein FGO68_gene2373 [Halteria grandinella]